MASEITLNGSVYVRSKDAAARVGLVPGYVGRMCREGSVDGKLLAGTWYVNEHSLKNFLDRQAREKAKRVEENAAALREERRRAEARAANLLASMPMHAASIRGHMEAPALAPVFEFLQKLFAVIVAVLFTIGTYALIDSQYARIAERSSSLSASLVSEAREQLAAAAENPMGAFSNMFEELARAVNRRVDTLVYDIMFPRALVEGSSGKPVARVVPRAVPRPTDAPQPPQQTLMSEPTRREPARGERVESVERVIERVIETQRIVSSAGGLTEEILNARLSELDNKMSSQIYAVASVGSANSTQIVNNYNAVGGALRIDELDDIALKDSTITGGSISGASVSATSLTVTGGATSTFGGGIQATALNITSSAATSTFANGINLADGCFAVDGTCITASGGGGGTPGGSDTQVQFNNNGSFAGNANFTFSSSTNLLKVTNASSTFLSVFDRIYVGGTATTTIRGDGFASTLPFASSTALTVSGTGYFGSASTTNLTISGTQNGILATNATGLVGATTTPTADYFISTSGTASRFPYASSTALTVSGTGYFATASTTNLTVSGIQSSLLFAGGSGGVSGTTTLSVRFGGTGSTTLTGLLKGNGVGALLTAIPGTDYVQSTTGDWTGTLDGLEGAIYRSSSFSTTSASYFLSQHQGAAFATTSADYWVTASTTIPKTTLAINWNALQTFQSGLISQASSTFTGFTQFAAASTTQLTNSGTTWLTSLSSAVLGVDTSGKVVATSSIGANLLSGTITNSQLANSSVTINSAGLLSGGGSVSLGGSLTLNASTSPTVGYLFATSTRASEIPFASSTALTVSGTGFFSTASTTNLTVSGIQSGLLSTNATGVVVATTTPTADYFVSTSGTASRFPYASSTALTVSGTGYFTVASTTNLTVSSIQSSLLFAGASGSVSGTTTLSVPFGGTGSTTLTGLLKGNGVGALLTAIPGTDYVQSTTGDWTGTLDGLDGSSYLANSFSTTSASYFLSQNRGASFSTTSADYWVTASTTIPKTTLAINWNALQTFQSGLLSQASSTFTGFTQLANASTTQFTNSGTTWLTSLSSAVLGVDTTGKVVATTTIGANLLSGTITNSQLANSSVTINSAGLLSGGGSVSLGGTLTLNASTSPTVGYVFATSTIASTLPYASSTALTVSGTGYFGTATSTSFYGANLKDCTSNNVLTWSGGSFGCEADDTGAGGAWPFTPTTYNSIAVQATSTGLWLTATSPFSLIASSTFATQASTTLFTNSGTTYLTALTSALLSTDSSGKVVSTTTIGANLIGGTLTDAQISSASVWHGKLASSSLQTSALLAGLLGDETGTGNVVFSASPTFTGTPLFAGLLSLSSTTIGNGTQAGGLTISGGATTTGNAYFAGNVGIGTTSPFAKLSIHANNGETNKTLFAIASSTASATTTLFSVDNTGLTTIGDSSGTGDANFQFASDANAWTVGYKASDKSFNIASSTNLTGTAALSIAKNGNTTIVGSAVTCTIGNGSSATNCSSSDRRLKTNIAPLHVTSGLAAIDALNPVSFNWNQWMQSNGLASSTQYGFIAQDVQNVFPTLVTQDQNTGYYKLDYQGFIAPTVKAIQELHLDIETIASTTSSSTPQSRAFGTSFFANLFTRIAAWLADTTNGIERIVARVFKGERGEFEELCVGSTCVTEAQFLSVFGTGANDNAPTSVSPSPSGIGELPAITTPVDLTKSEQSDNANATTTPSAANDNNPPGGETLPQEHPGPTDPLDDPAAATTTSAITEPSNDIPDATAPETAHDNLPTEESGSEPEDPALDEAA